MKTIEASAWSRASVDGLEITGDLFGAVHSFDHDARKIEVRLPVVELGPDLRPLRDGDERASFRSGRSCDPTLETNVYALSWIEISAAFPQPISVPPKLLAVSPKRPAIAGPKLTAKLDSLAIEYEGRLFSALTYWESVVRWICGSSALGTPSWEQGRESSLRLSFTALVQDGDKHRFWLPTHMISALRGTAIDAQAWLAIATALSAGAAPPPWFRFIDEAYHRYRGWDAAGTVLSCAIGCETLAREIFWIASGATGSEAARELMDRVPVRGILNRWETLTGIPREASGVRRVAKLFETRNRLMHAGARNPKLSRSDALTFLVAAKRFIEGGDDWYHASTGQINPRLKRDEPI